MNQPLFGRKLAQPRRWVVSEEVKRAPLNPIEAVSAEIESVVLTVRRRHDGAPATLDFGLSLLDPRLGLDSLELAEIMVELERRFGIEPFEGPTPPRSWADIAEMARRSNGEGLGAERSSSPKCGSA